MRSDKRQTFAMIGIALIVVAGILVYIGVSQPKLYDRIGTQAPDLSSVQSIIQSGSNNVIVSNNGSGNVNIIVSGTQNNDIIYPLNLNTATVDDLMQISGLGEVRANAIVAYREEIGQYSSVEQITDIKGIGDGIYAKVAPYLTV